jgi:hypothetical protein
MLRSRILSTPARPTTLGIDSVAPYLGLYESIGITTRSSRSTASTIRAAAAAFLGQDDRYGHRVYAGIIINAIR